MRGDGDSVLGWIVALATLVAVSGGVSACVSEREQSAQAGGAGVQVHIDPETGEIIAPPPEAEAGDSPEALQGSAAEVDEPLVEVPSEVPGGGRVIDLRGRRGFYLTGRISDEGSAEAHCEDGPHEEPAVQP